MAPNSGRRCRAQEVDDRFPDLLYVVLGLHQTRVTLAMEFFTIRDFVTIGCVSKTIREQLKYIEYTKCRDGKDYLVPYPGFPGLLPKPGLGLYPHQLASLHAMCIAENKHRYFGALRGGILGDAPGLGKTITTLALIASTAGTRVVTPPEFWDNNSIDAGWKSLRKNEAMRENVNKSLKPIRTWTVQNIYKRSIDFEIFKQVIKYVEPPYDDNRFLTINEFERYVRNQLKHIVAQPALDLFRENIVDIKGSLDKSLRKLLVGSSNAAVLHRRMMWERRLTPTSTTLIIAPDALFEHWAQQIQDHLDLDYLSEDADVYERGGVVYLDGVGDMVNWTGSIQSLNSVSLNKPLPPVGELVQYTIVLTTFSRCKNEFANEMNTRRMSDTGDFVASKKRRRSSRSEDKSMTTLQQSTSPLLRIRWLRVVVDEGHELGTHEAADTVTTFINNIAAERRWVLSGTPTTGNEDSEGFDAKALDQIQRLLYFLRHPKFGCLPMTLGMQNRSGGKQANDWDDDDIENDRRIGRSTNCPITAWNEIVKAPFLARKENGRKELLNVLKETMVMHRKEDINLPAPIFIQIERYAPFPDDVQDRLLSQYFRSRSKKYLHNELDEYLHTSDYQSLVDQEQAEYIIQSLQRRRNRLAQRLGQRQQLQLPAPDFPSTPVIQNYDTKNDVRPIKAVVYSTDTKNLLSVADQILRRVPPEHIAELYGSRDVAEMTNELIRFRKNEKESRPCPICHHENSVFGGKRSYYCQNTLLEVVLASHPRHRFLIERERIRGTINVPASRMDGELIENYHVHSKFWEVGDVLLVDVRDPHPILPARMNKSQWRRWGSDVCVKNAENQGYEGVDWYFGPVPQTASDGYAEVILKKWQTCGKFHNRNWFSGPTLRDQKIKRTSQDVYGLMLDSGLAHGLDLSFVTHMYLLEPIDDAALLEQVASRAHRLGATGPVTVETLNVFYKVNKDLKNAVGESGSSSIHKVEKVLTKQVIQNVEKVLTKQVCEHCFRSFETLAAAELHENTTCPRNPANMQRVDPFRLSSVYREIRPPRLLEQDSATDSIAQQTARVPSNASGPSIMQLIRRPNQQDCIPSM